MSSKLKNKNLGDIAAMKNLFNGNLMEIIKPMIKQKSNESVMKMMDIIKDKPDSWFEFLAVSTFILSFLDCNISSKYTNCQIYYRELRHHPPASSPFKCNFIC